ncbi:unnamed protein product [Parajaminaea phylloscopi]
MRPTPILRRHLQLGTSPSGLRLKRSPAAVTAAAAALGSRQRGRSIMSANHGAIRPGTERIVPLLEALGSPQAQFSVIHIAGTNSKGTTSAVLDSLLTSLGFLTARFNSPHLRYARDSCRIGGVVIDEPAWLSASQRVHIANDGIAASDFEQLFARFLTVCWQRAGPKPQILIVECGMGGKMDATNVFPAESALASVITPIGLDHKAFLGDTLAQITEQKMGIVKEQGLVVVADQRSAEAAAKHRSSLPPNPSPRQLVEHLARWGAAEDNEAALGPDVSEVMTTIRREAETRRARMVRCDTPSLEPSTSSAFGTSEHRPWQLLTQYQTLLPPILQAEGDPAATQGPAAGHHDLAATLFTNTTYHALPGQAPLRTPPLPPLPPTRAATSAVSTALSTLFAIASDEPPSARQLSGSDPHEDLRLQLAWSLRDTGILSGERGALDPTFSAAIEAGVRDWQGRGSWVDVAPLAAQSPLASEKMDTDQAMSPQGNAMHLLVDGAHNEQALTALFSHVRDLIRRRYQAGATARNAASLRVSLIVALSSSKEADGDLDSILGLLASLPDTIESAPITGHEGQVTADDASGLATMAGDMTLAHRPQSLPTQVTVDVAFTEFETPVEGMSWVRPIAAAVLAQRFTEIAQRRVSSQNARLCRLGQVRSDPSLSNTLGAIAPTCNGKPDPHGHEDSLCILTGSLYLVGQLYRLIESDVQA